MGVCQSCLGLGRRASQSDDASDAQQLLGDPYQPHYGSINQGVPRGAPEPDPEEIRRQRDALERICAQTSDKLIDVSQPAFAEEGSKMRNEYPRLFNDTFSPSQRPESAGSASSTPLQEEDESVWLERIVAESGAQGEESWNDVSHKNIGALTIPVREALVITPDSPAHDPSQYMVTGQA